MNTPANLKFAKSHEWINAQGDSGVVGISDHAQHEITDVVHVELPKAGRKVKAGEACAVVESVKAAFDIYAPVSGEITAVNDAIVKDPSIVNQSPYDKGWFFKIKISDSKELSALMDDPKYQEFIKSAAAH